LDAYGVETEDPHPPFGLPLPPGERRWVEGPIASDRQGPGLMSVHGLADSWFRRGLYALVLVGLLARGAVLVPALGRLEDPDNYLPLARALAEGRGFLINGRPTAYRPPLYPMVLAPLTLASTDQLGRGVAGLHLVLGGATVALTALTARRWGLSNGRALAAAAIVACDPVLVVQARAVMTETLSAFLLAATLAALTVDGRLGAALGGMGFGLASLCRPSILPALILVAGAAFVMGPGGWRRRARSAVVMVAAAVATMAPWAWRNARVLGEPVWTTTHGGYTLALANNPVYYAEVLDGPPGAVWSGPNQRRWWDDIGRETSGMTEPRVNRILLASGARMLVERPRDFARATLARLGRFWGVAPSGAVYPARLRLATALWTVPLWAALVLGSLRRDHWTWPRISALLCVAALTAVHAVFWTDMRMRAPIVPAIALIAVGCGGASRDPRNGDGEGPETRGKKTRKITENSQGSAFQIPKRR